MPSSGSPWWVSREFYAGLMLMVLSALPFCYSAQELGTELEVSLHGVRAEATVTSSEISREWVYDSRRGNHLQTRVNVTFRFTKLDGTTVAKTRKASSLMYPVGSKVEVWYLPDNPSVMELGRQEFGDRGFLIGLVAMAMLVSGAGLVVMAKLGLARGMLSDDKDLY